MRNVEPSFGEKLTRVLPYVWKEGRAELDALLALAIADIAEMEQADARGVLDQYLASKSRMLRYRGSLATAIAILQALALRVREEIAEQGSLGEVISAFSGAISGLTGTTGSSASEPDTSTASEPTTAGTEATSSTEPPSQSSTDSLG
jgi:hypothetical protein